MKRIVDITLPHTRYSVIIEPGVISQLGKLLDATLPGRRCALLSEANVFSLYGAAAQTSLENAGYDVTVATFPSGEESKHLDTIRSLYDVMLDAKLDRSTPVVALGGGVVGDMAGFVAATYLRGVPFLQCPTTLLAMVDASIGGKVGVNVRQGKNLIGAIHQPSLVLIDPSLCSTLDNREFASGLAECVKHGILGDAKLFEYIEQHLPEILKRAPEKLSEFIERNVRLKAEVIMADEREHDRRALLNLGHTFAHAIEVQTDYRKFLHGEAVSLGVVAATRLAEQTKRCPLGTEKRIAALLKGCGLPISTALPPAPTLLKSMYGDKKVLHGKLRLVLPDRIGSASIVEDVAESDILDAWQYISRS